MALFYQKKSFYDTTEIIGQKHSKKGTTWYNVYTLKGQQGWVSKKYVRERKNF